jgi:hypothetical protein
VNTDEHALQQGAVGTLSFIAAAARYQADVVRSCSGITSGISLNGRPISKE